MNPKIADTGHSFKGAFSYYLHDKRTDPADPYPVTSERVAWTEMRNLATENPHMAWRIMLATANNADELKQAAGVKNTGRKATGGPVFSYSLSWRADEAVGVTREDMARAADATLKLLKADHLQAAIICHCDTANPHVHIVVNRIDPTTGKTHSFGQSKNKLSDWAARYESGRGQIVTPERQDAAKAREEARQRPAPESGPSAGWAKRRREEKARLADIVKKESAATPPRMRQEQPNAPGRTQTPGNALKARHDEQKARHAAERSKLWADQKAQRMAVFKAAGQEVRERAQQVRALNAPLWSDLKERQQAERKRFYDRERHLVGKVWNAIDAVTSRQIRGDGSDHGFLSMAFAYLTSRDARRMTLDAAHRSERDQLKASNKARFDADVHRIKEARDRTLADGRAAFDKQSGALKTKHAAEAADIRRDWAALRMQREQAAQTRQSVQQRDRSHIRLQAKTARRDTRAAWLEEAARRATVTARYASIRQQAPTVTEEPEVVKSSFDKARNPHPASPPVPNRTEMLSRPSPSPSPAGDVPPINRVPAPVPAIDKIKASGAEAVKPPPPALQHHFKDALVTQAPPRARDWGQAATPSTPAPAKDWGRTAAPEPAPAPAKDWSQTQSQTATPTPTAAKDWTASATPSTSVPATKEWGRDTTADTQRDMGSASDIRHDFDNSR